MSRDRCEVCLGEHVVAACTATRERATVTIRVEDLHRLAASLDKLDASTPEPGDYRAALEVADDAERVIRYAQRQLGGAA